MMTQEKGELGNETHEIFFSLNEWNDGNKESDPYEQSEENSWKTVTTFIIVDHVLG